VNRRLHALLIGGIVLATVGGAAWAVRQMVAPSRERVYSCARIIPAKGPDPDPGYCERVARDRSRRAELPPGRADALAPDLARAGHAIESAGCPTATPAEAQACARRQLEVASTGHTRPSDLDRIHQALVGAGYRDATVRLARHDDPVERDSVYIAIPVGDACLVGAARDAFAAARLQPVGRLPGRTCAD
jgi:hypothetical protein